MQIIDGIDGLHASLDRLRGDGRLALVPTMGALHDGHLRLVAEARARADAVVASIFVNPTQFNDPADLERYPRDLDGDAAKLEAAGCDLVWRPTPDDLYPDGFATTVTVGGALAERWEGTHRPGHFAGVATVVTKLFTNVRPDVALFGEKDFQQLAIIRRLTADLDLGVEVVGIPTVRDTDGLALSSRNALLAAGDRARATALPDALSAAAERLRGGEAAAPVLADAVARLEAAGFGPIDYVALVDAATLEPLARAHGESRLIAAASLGAVRLIDNLAV